MEAQVEQDKAKAARAARKSGTKASELTEEDDTEGDEDTVAGQGFVDEVGEADEEPGDSGDDAL